MAKQITITICGTDILESESPESIFEMTRKHAGDLGINVIGFQINEDEEIVTCTVKTNKKSLIEFMTILESEFTSQSIDVEEIKEIANELWNA